MTNERYLIVSYFFAALLCVVVALLTYLFLRRSLAAVADSVPDRRLPEILKRLFPAGLLLPGLLAFTSVSYLTCDEDTYDRIIQNRAYLVERNQRQISRTLLFLLIAVLFWDVVVLFVLKHGRSRRHAKTAAKS